MAVEEAVPPTVADPRRLAGRVDDIGEHERRQDPVDPRGRGTAGEQLRHLVDDRIPFLRDLEVATIEWDQLRPGDVFRQVAPMRQRKERVVALVEHHGRNLDERQH